MLDLLKAKLDREAKRAIVRDNEGALVYGPVTKEEAEGFVEGVEYANDRAPVVEAGFFVYVKYL
jgi:hypothetical protein